MNRRRFCNVLGAIVLLAFAWTGPTQAGTVRGQAVFGLWSYDVVGSAPSFRFRVDKSEIYHVFQVQQKLRDLRSAAVFDYAPTNGGFLPDFASDLFLEGFISDPIAFYSNGDADPTPTTIDNDIPDGVNSSQISFSFPGAGIEVIGSQGSSVLFEDNSPSNNAGLGKYYATLSSSNIGFEPAVPRSFSQIALNVQQASETEIFTGGNPPVAPYSFELPTDAVVNSRVGPHRFDLRAEGTVTQEVLDVYMAEGFGNYFDSVQVLANGTISLPNTSIVGPASSNVEISAYIYMEALVSTPIGSASDYGTILASLTAYDNASPEVVQFQSGLSGSPDYGFSRMGDIAIVEYRILSSGDPDYVLGMSTARCKLVAHLPILLDTSKEYFLSPFVALLRVALVNPDTVPGNFASVSAQVFHPVTPDQSQVKLYVPAGYALSMNDPDGPNDLILAAIKGDPDLDGIIGSVDQSTLIAAYTGPLGGSGYTPATPDNLATFDFDGDGDIDCSDYQELVAGWSAGGSPSAFSGCDNDSDSDGVADADDGCAGTPVGAMVSAIGCLRGDFNQDGIVSGGDAAGLTDCMAGLFRFPNPTPPNTLAACLNTFDFDGDYDVDLEDYAEFQRQVQ